MKRMIRRCGILLLAVWLAMGPGAAGADGVEITLPGGVHRLTIPEEMIWQAPADDEENLKAIYLMPPDLDMMIFAYNLEGYTIRSLAETMTEAGRDAQVREIAGEEFLFYTDTDEADGAVGVIYGYMTGNRMTEITFFCGSQAAMDLTQVIMESFHS